MMLRVKNGYAHERTRPEISQRITDLEANPSGDEFILGSPDEQAGAKVSKARKNGRRF